MKELLSPVILTVIIAFAAAVLLTIAAVFLAVKKDETAEKVRECLPGANCGGCGFAGCDDYAEQIAKNPDLPLTLCAPGGAGAANAIAEVLGRSAGEVIPKVAVVKCSGYNDVAKTAMEYQGISSCASAKELCGGPNACKYGCLGFGDCASVCPVGAIEICNGVAKIDRTKCTGCGACSKKCPKGVIELVPAASRVYVGCSSNDFGKTQIANCTAGCLGCRLCEKTCKFDAIHVENNVAYIDPEKCKNCGMCAKVCPKHIIHVVPKPVVKPAQTEEKA